MRRRGSITVFCTLTMMLVASFLFALLEAGRVYGLQSRADMISELGIESVCAEYQPVLWENYRLLCLDGAYAGGDFSMENVSARLKSRLETNLDATAQSGSLFLLEATDVAPEQYQVLTDQAGEVFLSCVSDYMKNRCPTEWLNSLYEQYQQEESVAKENNGEDSITDAKTALEDAKTAALEASKEQGNEQTQVQQPPPDDTVENPLEIALEIKRNAFLGMVVEDIGAISAKETDLSDSLMKRTKNQGTMEDSDSETGVLDKVLAVEYADEFFLSYTDADARQEDEGRSLDYELEYILCGKESDAANLEATAKKLLALREAANIMHIVSDGTKREETAVAAEALAGFTMNPVIIKAVQIGIIAAWAYLESIQDVRALLRGDRVALIKTDRQWTIQLKNMLTSFQNATGTADSEDGLTYEQYVKGFLFLENKKKLAYRMMDLMERRLRNTEGYAQSRMDYMLCDMTYEYTYRATPLFARLTSIGKLSAEEYEFSSRRRFSYATGNTAPE